MSSLRRGGSGSELPNSVLKLEEIHSLLGRKVCAWSFAESHVGSRGASHPPITIKCPWSCWQSVPLSKWKKLIWYFGVLCKLIMGTWSIFTQGIILHMLQSVERPLGQLELPNVPQPCWRRVSCFLPVPYIEERWCEQPELHEQLRCAAYLICFLYKPIAPTDTSGSKQKRGSPMSLRMAGCKYLECADQLKRWQCWTTFWTNCAEIRNIALQLDAAKRMQKDSSQIFSNI